MVDIRKYRKKPKPKQTKKKKLTQKTTFSGKRGINENLSPTTKHICITLI